MTVMTRNHLMSRLMLQSLLAFDEKPWYLRGCRWNEENLMEELERQGFGRQTQGPAGDLTFTLNEPFTRELVSRIERALLGKRFERVQQRAQGSLYLPEFLDRRISSRLSERSQ